MEYNLDQLDRHQFDALTRSVVGEITRSADRVPTVGELRISGPLQLPQSLGSELWSNVLVLVVHVSGVDRRSDYERQLSAFVTMESSRRGADDESKNHGLLPHTTLDPFQMDAQEATPPPRPVALSHVIVATNLDATNPDDQELRQLAPLGLHGRQLWDADKFRGLLNEATDTQRRFLATTAPPDVLDRLHDASVGLDEDFLFALKTRLVSDVRTDQWVHLIRAGTTTFHRLKLSTIGVDLPLDDHPVKAVQFVTDLADRTSQAGRSTAPSNVLLLGGPGQGKSTIVQLIAQNYRLSLLDGSRITDSDTTSVIAEVEEGLRNADIRPPRSRRWPVTINLATYVEAAGGERKTSILRYIAEQIDPDGDRVTVGKVRRWLRTWPWLLLLDGLDEVASATGRRIVLERLNTFMAEAAVEVSDVVVVATTRPQGFAGELGPSSFKYVKLSPLTRDEAVSYGRRFIRARHSDDIPWQHALAQRIDTAASAPLTARLMETPLQVTIMSILLEARERAPSSRFDLFDLYYRTIYSRELDKKGGDTKLLEDYGQDIDALHDWLGIHLHAEAETSEGSDASIRRDDLREAVERDLQNRGHSSHGAAELADRILEAATTRLVLIVSHREDEIGFEVPSIQEFFAARSIVSGQDTTILKRLEETLEPVHWRETWLFAAGRIFRSRERPQLVEGILSLLGRADSRDSLRRVVAPGADLALDLLEDSAAVGYPLLQRTLVKQALELLRHAPDYDLYDRAATLIRLADDDDEILDAVDNAIATAARGTLAEQKAAHVALRAWSTVIGGTARRFRRALQKSDHVFQSGSGVAAPDVHLLQVAESSEFWAELRLDDRRTIDELSNLIGTPAAPADGSVPRFVADESGDVALLGTLAERLVEGDPMSRILADSLVRSSRDSWLLSSGLRSVVRAALQRQQVADRIVGPITTPLQRPS